MRSVALGVALLLVAYGGSSSPSDAGPTPGTFTAAGGLGTARTGGHTATPLPGGKVLIAALAFAAGTDGGTTGTPVVLAAAGSARPMSFREGMTRPVLRSSPNGKSGPNYPTDQQVFGLIIVQCILIEEGKAEGCAIVKGLAPWIDQRMLDWLAGSTWSPVTLEGKPQRVSYVFNFRFDNRGHIHRKH